MPPKKVRLSKEGAAKQNNKEAEKGKEARGSDSEDSDFEEEEGGQRIAGVYIPPAPAAACTAESIGPRLVITHIVNENFKSYAGRCVLGPFHKSFTCIIGPNGSGKSNVIDSMLFVFGYRATKIRSKKISVLLHKSENHRDIRSATVEVHFAKIIDKENGDYETVANSTFFVSRTANHDNSSFYTINGRRAQFKDVASLLGSHGIDLKHNRFLILQGEVEQIAMMKPKGPSEHESGMLEYLEDIIGTSRYKKPIEKLDAKVMELTEERAERLNRAKLAEKDKEALEGPMQEAVEYLRLTNRKIKGMNKLIQLQIRKASRKCNVLKEDKEKLDKEIEEKNERLKGAQEKLAEREKSSIGKKKELENLKSKREKLKETFNKIEHRDTQLKEEISQTNKKRKKAIDARNQEEKKLSDAEKVPEKNEKEIKELTVVQGRLQKEIEVEEAAVQKVLESLKEETKGLKEEKDQLENTLIGLKNARDQAKAKYELAKNELDVYLRNETREKEKLQNLKDNLNEVVTNLEEKKKTLTELKKTVPEMEKKQQEKLDELAKLRSEEAKVMSEVETQRSAVQEKRHSITTSASRNRVLDYLMKLKEKGEIPGIFGRLGDLGGIDARYDCAVSTACGALDHVVVDTTTTGKECVNALKRSGVGRGNFIALDQQNKFLANCQQRFKSPENVPRLFDLIKVEDPRIKPAFYFALRDTLVAEDLSQARRVAYGATRYRVVTLTGEIIEIAGTMSGGGRDKRTGRMGRSATVKTSAVAESPGAMARLEERLQRLQERAVELGQRVSAADLELRELNRQLAKAKTDLTNAQIDVKSLTEREPLLKSQLKAQEAVVTRTISDPKVVQEKTQNVNKLNEEYEAAAKESGALEKQVAALTAKIDAITSGRTQAAQQKLDKVTKQLDKVTAEMTKLTVAIKASERNVKKSRDRIVALSTEISEAEESLRRSQEEFKSLEEECTKVQEFIQDVQNKLSEVEAALEAEKGDSGSLSKEVNNLKADLMNASQAHTEAKKKLSEAEETIDTHKRKLSSLKLKVIPNEETADYSLPTLDDAELDKLDPKGVTYDITMCEEKLHDMTPNLKTIEEYKEKSEILKERMAEYKDVQDRRTAAKKGFEDVKKARFHEFMAGFTIICGKLREMYQMITFGGDAEFELVDTLDPFAEGISFSVRPPKKSWKNISNLSGGEKTLSSLALVFALHYYKPSPLYFMDEIDAALDFKNVSIVGHYIKERTKNAQFIIISLRSNMFELADVLVGIYKTYNCTKSITVTPELYVSKASSNENQTHHTESGGIDKSKSQTSTIPHELTSSPPKKRQILEA